jgi:AraC-like DNA-binding protein
MRELASAHGYKSRALAAALGISTRHLQRTFGCVFGQTPQAWLNEQRLLAARQMLHGARSVKEVAYKLGFGNATQFTRDFRRSFGYLPSTLLARGPAG